MTKEIYELALALKILQTMNYSVNPSSVQSISDDPPDVGAMISPHIRVGIELTRYQEESDPTNNQIRTNNQIHARNFTRDLAREWKKVRPHDSISIRPSYRIGPESTELFIPNADKEKLMCEILKVCASSNLMIGPIFMSTIPSSCRLIHEHLSSLSFTTDTIFDSDNYVMARASFEEQSVVNAIQNKTKKNFNGIWGELWLVIHGGETHSLIPSTSIARTAVHKLAASEAASSKFTKILIYDMGRVAELDFPTGKYRMHERANKHSCWRVFHR